ncbi:Serine/threonine protein kinase [Giardia duodenalis]|uniref:Uncharacterized protein n=2 Tax=Giardia intestinalis TaxID=5741 RepID=C6LQ33_GIAIB|nr:Hypothetical protein GL50581_854 [Giardia intestinalis ATCC 50581]ESU44739.1 Serine/threonine protein kinase [Giardia intestinalis]
MSLHSGFCEAFHDLRNRYYQTEYQKVLLTTYWELARALGHDCTQGISLERLIPPNMQANRKSRSSTTVAILERRQEAIIEAALNRTYSDGPFRLRLPTEVVQLIVMAQQNKSVIARITLKNGTPVLSIVFKTASKTKSKTSSSTANTKPEIPLSRGTRWIENDEQFSKTVICEAVRCQLKSGYRNIYNTWSPTITEYFVDQENLSNVISACRSVLKQSLVVDTDENIEDYHQQVIQGIALRKTTVIRLGRTQHTDNTFNSLAIPLVSYYMNSWSPYESNALLLSERFLAEDLSARSTDEYINSIRHILSAYTRLNMLYSERVQSTIPVLEDEVIRPDAKSSLPGDTTAKALGVCSIGDPAHTFNSAMLLFVPTPMQIKMIFTTAKEVLSKQDSEVLELDELYTEFTDQPYEAFSSNVSSLSNKAHIVDDYSAIYPTRSISPFLLRERGFVEGKRTVSLTSTSKSSASATGESEKSSSHSKRFTPIPAYNDLSICCLPVRAESLSNPRRGKECDMFSGTFRYTAGSYSEIVSIIKSRKKRLKDMLQNSDSSPLRRHTKDTDVTEVGSSLSEAVDLRSKSVDYDDKSRTCSAQNDVSNLKLTDTFTEGPSSSRQDKRLPCSNSLHNTFAKGTSNNVPGSTYSLKGLSLSNDNAYKPEKISAQPEHYSEPGRKQLFSHSSRVNSHSDHCFGSGARNNSVASADASSSLSFNFIRMPFGGPKTTIEEIEQQAKQKRELEQKAQKALEDALAEQKERLLSEQKAHKEDQKRLVELEKQLNEQRELILQRQEVEIQVQSVSTPLPTDKSELERQCSHGDGPSPNNCSHSNSCGSVEAMPQERIQDTQYYKYIVESEAMRIDQLSQLNSLKAHAKFLEFHQGSFGPERLCLLSASVYKELEAYPFAGTMKDIIFTMWMGYDISKSLMALFSSVRACALATPTMFEGIERNTMKNVIKAPNMNVVSERDERSKQVWYDRDKEILETILNLLHVETKHSVLELINFCSTMTRLLSMVKQSSSSNS